MPFRPHSGHNLTGRNIRLNGTRFERTEYPSSYCANTGAGRNGTQAVPYEMDEPYTAQSAAGQMSTGHLHEMVRVPPDTSKTGHPEWDDPFLVRQKGLGTLWCRRRRAAAEQMSTGHLYLMVRVPPDTSKTGHPDRATRCRYARRDSLH